MSAADAAREAARMTDPVEHGWGLLGMMLGAVLGAALVIATGGTGLLFVAAVLGAAAAGGLAGGKIAHGLSGILGSSGITTGAIVPACSPDIVINDLHASRAVLDGAACNGVYSLYHIPMPLALIAEGSDTVVFNGMPAARKGDKLVCGADIKMGSQTVFLGGGTIRMLAVHDPEEEFKQFLEILGLASIGLLLGGFLAGAVCGTVLLEALAGMAVLGGVHLGVGMIADALGLDSNWKELLDGVVDLGAIGISARVGRGEPVDVVTGELLFRTVDIDLPGVLPLTLARTYLSGLEGGSAFGPKWRSTWGQWIERRDGKLVYETDDGRSLRFAELPAGDEARHPEAHKVSLARAGAGYHVRDESGRTLRFEREVEGRFLLTRIEDRNGNAIHLRHDEGGALREVVHTGGYRLEVDGAPGRIEAVRLVSGGAPVELVRYGYDARGRLDAITDASGLPFRFAYDDADRIVRWVDRTAVWFEYRYDAEGRIVETVGPDDLYHYRFAYDPFGRQSKVTDSLGHATVYQYTRKHRVIRQENPDGGVVRTTWDASGNRVEIEDPEGGIISYTYDARGNVTSMTDPTGAVRRAVYNELDLPVELVDAGGGAWQRAYDERGNTVSVRGPGGEEWSFVHDERGLLRGAKNPLGHERVFESTPAGLVARETDWLGHHVAYEHDALGRTVARRDDTGRETRYRYDACGRLAGVTLPTGAELAWRYDPEGNLVEQVDAMGHRTMYGYGPFRWVAELLKPSGGKMRFERDTEGRLSKVVDERGDAYRFGRDAMGRVVRELDYAGRRRAYAYDRAGRCVAVRGDAGELVAKVEHDAAGRILRRVSGDGWETTFAYDARGAVVLAKNDDASVSFERDAWGRVVKETQDGVAVASAYDAIGRRVRRETSGGEAYGFAYDANGHLAELTLSPDERLTFARDAMGRETARTTSAGLALRHEHDGMSHVTRQVVGLGAAASADLLQRVLERRWAYNQNGDPVEVKDSVWGLERYAYDADGAPVSADKSDLLAERFAYDAAGDVTRRERAATGGDLRPLALGASDFAYARGGRLEGAGATRYEYDGEGRVVARLRDGRRWQLTWSAEGRLSAVIDPAGQTFSYAYDAFGRRTRKRGPAGETRFLWDGDVLAEERDQAGGVLAAWIHEPRSFRPIAKREREKTYYCVNDPIGTPRELLTGDGRAAWSASFTLWGELAKLRAADVDCPMRFQGQYADAESGLYYNRYRYYDPDAGRYLSPDPVGLSGGPHPYSYVHNPLAWVDPWGLMPWAWNPDTGMGHHLVYRNKANSVGLDDLGTERNTPTYFPEPYNPGDHELMHRAQDPFVGGRQGPWTGTSDELLAKSREGLAGVDNMRGTLKIPSTGEVIAKDVSPTQAFDKLMEWHQKQTGGTGGACS